MPITTEALLGAALLFGMRVLNNAIGTVRLIMLSRQRVLLTAVLGFFEAMIFAITIATVVIDLTNWLNLLSYCLGFSIGGFLGMAIERRFITSYVSVNVIAAAKGHEIAVALRERGYGVTETRGEGRSGEVTMLRSVVMKRDMPHLLTIIRETNPEAFVAVEEARTVYRGWLRSRNGA